MTEGKLDQVRWGIIGCGDVAEHKSGPAFSATPDSELVAVMRRDRAKAADFARRHEARRWYDDAAELVGDPEVNAVYIASPHALHIEHVRLAAEAGKAVLCEKPLGTSAREAEQIVSICREHGVPLAVAYYRRLWPVVVQMRTLLAEGAIGELLSARVLLLDGFFGDPARSWLVDRRMAGGGALSNAGSHWVDLVRFLLGDVDEVSAICGYSAGFEVEDSAQLSLRHSSGMMTSLYSTWRSKVAANEFEIVGTTGRIIAAPLSEGRLTLLRAGQEPLVQTFGRAEPAHAEFVGALVPALRTAGALPAAGEDAVAVWRIMEAAYRSDGEHCAIRL